MQNVLINVEAKGMRELIDKLAAMQVDVEKQVRIASWAAQKKIRSLIARLISKNVVNQPMKVTSKAVYSKMRDDGFLIVIRGNFSVAIKRFKPKQNKKGVTAYTGKKTVKQNPITGKVDTVSTGKNVFPSAFMGPRPGASATKLRGAVVKRKVKSRLPIGAVPAVNIVLSLKNVEGTVQKLVAMSQDELVSQVEKRIRFLTLKQQKKLNWQQ